MASLQVLSSQSEQSQALGLDLLVGITQELNAPVDLFLSLDDLASEATDVRFVITRMGGETTVAVWGHYSFTDRRYHIDQGCKPSLNILSQLYRQFNQNNFSYSGNSVRDRIYEAMGHRTILNPLQYLKTKYLLAYERNEISESQLQSRFPGEDIIQDWEDYFYRSTGARDLDRMEDPDRFQQLRDRFISQRQAEIRDYEIHRNRSDVDRDLLRSLQEAEIVASRLMQVFSDFSTQISQNTLVYPEYVATLPPCLTKEQCQVSESPACLIYEHIATLDLT